MRAWENVELIDRNFDYGGWESVSSGADGAEHGQSWWDWGRLTHGKNKTPLDLRDFSESTFLEYKDGSRRPAIRQKAASKGKNIAVTAGLAAQYLASRLLEVEHNRKRMLLKWPYKLEMRSL